MHLYTFVYFYKLLSTLANCYILLHTSRLVCLPTWHIFFKDFIILLWSLTDYGILVMYLKECSTKWSTPFQLEIYHTFVPLKGRPSKCPKFYASRNLEEQNLFQKVCEFCQNLNHNKITYLIKYTLTVQFSIIKKRIYIPTLHWTFTKEIRKIWTKKSINDKTP